MPDPSPREKDLFLAALERTDPTERAAYLAQACGDDDALRRQVEAMLQTHAAADSFLEKPAAALGATVDSEGNVGQPTGAQDVGAQIGPYKLLQPIGEGGMGVVYLAEQHEPVR